MLFEHTLDEQLARYYSIFYFIYITQPLELSGCDK